MKRRMLTGALLLMCCGCSTMNNTEKGLGIGALVGGGIGTMVGLATHHPATGAAVGAALGAGVGGIAGASADHEERKEQIRQTAAVQAAQQSAQQAAANAPRLDEIVTMTKNGVPESSIITQIRNSGAVYKLNSDDLVYLSQNGVSSQVMIELQNSAQRPVYATTTVIYPRRYYAYDPYPPPVSVGIGFVGGGCRRW